MNDNTYYLIEETYIALPVKSTRIRHGDSVFKVQIPHNLVEGHSIAILITLW
jgi:hypothetical protein